MPHRQSFLTLWTKSNQTLPMASCSQVWELCRHQPIHTKQAAHKLCLLSVRGLSAWARTSGPWLMTRVVRISKADTRRLCWLGVVSALFSLHYSYYFSDQPSCWVHACVCACTVQCKEGFSMASVVQVCVMKSWVLFWKPWEFQSFSHLRLFSLHSLLLFFLLTHLRFDGKVRPRSLNA